jgi:hypothetical protein
MSSSLPRMRTTFCTLVARGTSGVASPRKYGLNCTMPATVRNTVGSLGISDDDGQTRWSWSRQKSRKARRIWSERID